MPGEAAIKNTAIEMPRRIPGNHFLYSNFVILRIVIIIESGRNTEPRYETLFAHKAPFSVFEIESEKYPAFTMNTDINRTINQMSFFFIEKKYPKSITKERMVVTKYMIDILVALSPIELHPDKNNIGNKHIKLVIYSS